MTKETNGKKVFLAVDLGAGSGRVMAAAFDGVKISLEEVSRWASAPIKIGNSLHWDTDAIFGEIVGGIKKARAIFGNAIESVGIDSWAVDYGFWRQSSQQTFHLPRRTHRRNDGKGFRQNSQTGYL